MAGETYYASITSRYGTTYTSDDDNMSDIVNATSNCSRVGNNITVTGDAAWNGQLNSSVTNLVAFNRTFLFTAAASHFYSTSVSGCHHFYVNCTFVFSGQQSVSANNVVGTADEHNSSANGGVGSRNGNVTPESTTSTANFYNCKFIFIDTNAARPGLVYGHMENCYEILGNATSGGVTFFPMNQATLDGLYVDDSIVPTNSSAFGTFVQFIQEPASFDNVTAINGTAYLDAGQNEYKYRELTNFGGSNIVGYGGNTGDQKQLLLLTVPNSSPGTARPTFGLINAGFRFDTDGSVQWRRIESDANGKVILMQRIQQRYFSDAQLSNNRKDVLYRINTQVSYSDTEERYNIAHSSLSKTNYRYVSDTDGYLDGSYNPNGGFTSTAEFQNLDLPVCILRPPNSNIGNSSTFTNQQTYLETDVQRMSLWGTTFDSVTKNSNVFRTTADADGFFLPPDVDDQLVDQDDAFMVEYGEDTDTLKGKFNTSSDATISLNDLAAIYKYAVWNQDLEFSNWSDSVVSDDTFDIQASGITFQNIELDTAATDLVATSGSVVLFDCPTAASGDIEIVVGSSDIVKKMDLRNLTTTESGDAIVIQGDGPTTSQVTCLNFDDAKTFSSIPGDNDYTIKDISFGGNIRLSPTSGQVFYVRFDNVSNAEGADSEIRIINNGEGSIIYTVAGDNTPTIDTTPNSGTIASLTQVIVNRTDTDVDFSVYDATGATWPITKSNFATQRIVNVSGSNDTEYVIASSGGDHTDTDLGGSITKVLVVGTKESEDSFWEVVDVVAGQTATVNVSTTAITVSTANIPGGATVTHSIGTSGNEDNKLVMSTTGLDAVGASASNRLMMESRNQQAYRDFLAIENDSGNDILTPVGTTDWAYDAAKAIFKTSTVNQSLTISESNISNLTNSDDDPNNNPFSVTTSASVTIGDTTTTESLTVQRLDLPTGVPGDTFSAGLDTINNHTTSEATTTRNTVYGAKIAL